VFEAIKKHGCFDISVSAYPEKHPESSSFEADINLLKAKIDAGADQAITQFAFDTDVYASFRDKVIADGINIPVIPGIMPTTNFKGVQRMAEKCGITGIFIPSAITLSRKLAYTSVSKANWVIAWSAPASIFALRRLISDSKEDDSGCFSG
jgi:5,10-methylenetetrahydrofolate reductase